LFIRVRNINSAGKKDDKLIELIELKMFDLLIKFIIYSLDGGKKF
jgi:hypothetical protein